MNAKRKDAITDLPVFPYEEAKKHLIEAAKRWIPIEFRDYADKIVELHLREENFPMPISVDMAQLKQGLIEGKSLKDLHTCFKFEKSQTQRGIARVMVRTHLNRSGMNYVSRGFKDKTQAPRVLGIFSNDHFKPTELCDWKVLTKRMLEYGLQSKKLKELDDRGEIIFSDTDLDSLKNLSEISFSDAQDFLKTKEYKKKNIHNNWVRLLVGIHSGFNHLDKEYGFDKERIWKSIDEASKTSKGVKELIAKTKDGVEQFGDALAGSFFADLGAAQFIKSDVHVVDAIEAFTGRSNSWVKADGAFNVLHTCAIANGVTPRAVDKLIYISCSTNLYLFNQSNDEKNRFLDFLGNQGLQL